MLRTRAWLQQMATAAKANIEDVSNWPAHMATLVPHPAPAHTYAEATARIAALQTSDTAAVNPVCRLGFLTHGSKVEHATVLLHGFTNCPHQFAAFGALLHEAGQNVLIPRIPHHGMRDRLTVDLAALTAEELIAFTDTVIDIAHGLAERVTLVGLSGGGVAAAWAAQNRSDLERAVIIAPVFGMKLIPPRLLTATMKLGLLIPNRFVWWDSKLKADAPRPPQAYPRFATRALAEVLRLGAATRRQARKQSPATADIVMITNAHDAAVDNNVADALVQLWRDHSVPVETYTFPDNLDLIHDMIDPGQPLQQTALVYPVLLRLITAGHTNSPSNG